LAIERRRSTHSFVNHRAYLALRRNRARVVSICVASFSSAFLAFFQIEFAGGEDRDCLDALDILWNPQVWNTCFLEFFAQLGKIDVFGTEQNERFALCLVLHTDNRDGAFISPG